MYGSNLWQTPRSRRFKAINGGGGAQFDTYHRRVPRQRRARRRSWQREAAMNRPLLGFGRIVLLV